MDRRWKSMGRILGPIINACLPHHPRHRPRTSQVSKRMTYRARGSTWTINVVASTTFVRTSAERLKSAANGARNSGDYIRSDEQEAHRMAGKKRKAPRGKSKPHGAIMGRN